MRRASRTRTGDPLADVDSIGRVHTEIRDGRIVYRAPRVTYHDATPAGL